MHSIRAKITGVTVGVIGIELDYSAMAEEVNNITLYQSGYAFLNDAEGNLIYHPHMDAAALTAMGCSSFQGYYFSRPIPVREFEKKYAAAE